MEQGACEHPTEAHEASIGIFLIGMLTDWRLWAIAFGSGLVIGIVTTVLGVGQSSAGAGVGAATGIYTAFRLGRIRRCRRCKKLVRLPLGAPIPPPQK